MELGRLGSWWVVVLLSVATVAAAGPDLQRDPRLVEAVKDRNKPLMLSLLKDKVDVNVAQADGTTPLIWAASSDDLETVDLLIRSGASVNAATDYGVTALSLACTNRNTAMVDRLLKAKANPNIARTTGETPLMTCARTGDVEAVKMLLVHGASVNAKVTERGQSALMWAAAEKHPDVVQVLVDHGADVHARSRVIPLYTPTHPITYSMNVYFPKTKGGFTPLMFAAQSGDVDSARILLAAGANVNEGTQEDGSALGLAAENGHMNVALFLLEKGADANITDAYGITPLHWAVQGGLKTLAGRPAENDGLWEHGNMPELVTALLVHGANPNARIKKDFEPYDIHRFARNRGNDLPQVNLTGATPFLLAGAATDTRTMRALIEGKADPQIGTVEGLTPVMAAAGLGCERLERGGGNGGGGEGAKLPEELEKKYLEAVQEAVKWGGDINAPGPGGRTALHAAVFNGETETIKFLVEHGADLNAQDMYGQTAMTIAMGDPGELIFRQIPPAGDDYTFRRPKLRKPLVDLLIKLGAAPYNGPVADRTGQ